MSIRRTVSGSEGLAVSLFSGLSGSYNWPRQVPDEKRWVVNKTTNSAPLNKDIHRRESRKVRSVSKLLQKKSTTSRPILVTHLLSFRQNRVQFPCGRSVVSAGCLRSRWCVLSRETGISLKRQLTLHLWDQEGWVLKSTDPTQSLPKQRNTDFTGYRRLPMDW